MMKNLVLCKRLIGENVQSWSWLKAATITYTFKTLLRLYAIQVLTQRLLDMKLGHQCNYHKGWAAFRIYANQPACHVY